MMSYFHLTEQKNADSASNSFVIPSSTPEIPGLGSSVGLNLPKILVGDLGRSFNWLLIQRAGACNLNS